MLKVKNLIWSALLLWIVASVPVHAQDLDARSPKKSVSHGKQRKAEKVKEKQAKKLEKAIKIGKKRHMKLQKKNTKKMMRKSRHQSANFNHDRKEFFLKRWFRKKHH
jgi:hypothetical protein